MPYVFDGDGLRFGDVTQPTEHGRRHTGDESRLRVWSLEGRVANRGLVVSKLTVPNLGFGQWGLGSAAGGGGVAFWVGQAVVERIVKPAVGERHRLRTPSVAAGDPVVLLGQRVIDDRVE